MNWTIEHNGFHGRTRLVFRVPTGTEPGSVVEVSPDVAERLNHAVCPCADCMCGERISENTYFCRDGSQRWTVGPLPLNGGEVLGHYPQA